MYLRPAGAGVHDRKRGERCPSSVVMSSLAFREERRRRIAIGQNDVDVDVGVGVGVDVVLL